MFLFIILKGLGRQGAGQAGCARAKDRAAASQSPRQAGACTLYVHGQHVRIGFDGGRQSRVAAAEWPQPART